MSEGRGQDSLLFPLKARHGEKMRQTRTVAEDQEDREAERVGRGALDVIRKMI